MFPPINILLQTGCPEGSPYHLPLNSLLEFQKLSAPFTSKNGARPSRGSCLSGPLWGTPAWFSKVVFTHFPKAPSVMLQKYGLLLPLSPTIRKLKQNCRTIFKHLHPKIKSLHMGRLFMYTCGYHTGVITAKLNFYVCVWVGGCTRVCRVHAESTGTSEGSIKPPPASVTIFFETGCLVEHRDGDFFV